MTGDVTQVDLPEGRASGLAEARALLSGIDGIAFCEFTDVDVVRHPLVQKIIVAYEKRDAREREKSAARGQPKSGPPLFPKRDEAPVSQMPATVAAPPREEMSREEKKHERGGRA